MGHHKKVNCSITLFCSIALLLIISLLFSLTEMCRMRVSKLYMQVACNAATDSLFSLYHRKLFDYYHIFGLENFDDDILKKEYENFLMPYIKNDDNEYLQNYYIADLKSDNINFKKENILDETYFEDEILSYMKYGIVDTVINFANNIYDMNNDIEKNLLYNDLQLNIDSQVDTQMYQDAYKKYFNFQKDIKKLENSAKKTMEHVEEYNKSFKNVSFSTSANYNSAKSNYEKLEKIYDKLYDIKENLNDFLSSMDIFRDKVIKSKEKYENDKKNIKNFNKDIDDFIIEEFGYFEEYVDSNSELNDLIRKEKKAISNKYPIITQYKNQCNMLMQQIELLKQEKTDVSHDKDMDSEDKKERKQEINVELDELYEECKELGKSMNDDIDVFKIPELYLPVSKNGNLDDTSMFDRIGQLFTDGFLGLVLDQNELNDLQTKYLAYIELDTNSNEKILDKILLSEYELKFFNFYKKESFDLTTKSNSDNLEIEQLISGKNNNKENLTSVIEKLLLIREGSNLIYLYGSSEKRREARAFATKLFAAFSPIVVEIMFVVILSSWALCQSILDVYNLLHEKRVPLIHNNDTFDFSINSILSLSSDVIKNSMSDKDNGLNYVDYMRILLILEDQNVLDERMASIMQYNIKKEQNNFGMTNLIYDMDIEHIFLCKHFFTDMLFFRPNNVKLDAEYKMKINTYYDYIE